MREIKLQDLKSKTADRTARLRRGARGRERQHHAQAGADVRDPQAAGRAARSRSSAKASSRSCRTASASCARPMRTTCRARTTSTSRPRRSAASACAPATPSRARSAAPRRASAISRCSRSTRSISRIPRRSRHKVHFDNLTPLYPERAPQARDRGSDARRISRPRVIDIVSPIGKGQRALIVAPPRTGKTVLLQNIAQSITDQPSRVLPHRAAHRRAAGGSHRHAALGEGRGHLLDLRRAGHRATCRSPRW